MDGNEPVSALYAFFVQSFEGVGWKLTIRVEIGRVRISTSSKRRE